MATSQPRRVEEGSEAPKVNSKVTSNQPAETSSLTVVRNVQNNGSTSTGIPCPSPTILTAGAPNSITERSASLLNTVAAPSTSSKQIHNTTHTPQTLAKDVRVAPLETPAGGTVVTTNMQTPASAALPISSSAVDKPAAPTRKKNDAPQSQDVKKSDISPDAGWSVPNPLASLGVGAVAGSGDIGMMQGSTPVALSSNKLASATTTTNCLPPASDSKPSKPLVDFRTANSVDAPLIVGRAPTPVQKREIKVTLEPTNVIYANQGRIPVQEKIHHPTGRSYDKQHAPKCISLNPTQQQATILRQNHALSVEQQKGAVHTPTRPLSQQNEAPARRKLVLSSEGREALTKAVLSSLKDPNGVMDPILLETAMQTTKLSKLAILNAAKMARERELKKRRANAAAALLRSQTQSINIVGAAPSSKRAVPTATPRPRVATNLKSRVRPIPSPAEKAEPQCNKPTGISESTTRPSKVAKTNAVGLAVALQKKISTHPKSDPQTKTVALSAAALSKEMMNWCWIQYGMFTPSKNTVPGKNIRSSCHGALSRVIRTTPVLTNDGTIVEPLNKSVRKELVSIQRSMRHCGALSLINDHKNNSRMKRSVILRDHMLMKTLNSRRLQHSNNAPLMDVTEKYKRLKLQPRKESRLLEKNLRKHRQVVCDKLVKRYKELNRSIMTQTNEFYKFHRLRKIETSKFARSVRDFVATEQRKKEKGVVNEEKARIAALKANDMEAYSVLVQETRNDRLKFLLNKTDEYIDQISGLLKDQQVDETRLKSFEKENDGSIDAGQASYYETAHVRQEEVQQPTNLIGGSLKVYQISGLQWLVSLYNNNLNGILADEMGLGKTVQTIALIAYLMERKDNRGPYLVIVPLSTLSNWVNEFRRWCPSATVIVYKGTPAQRKGLYRSEVREGHFNVLLTTYEYIIKDKSSLRKVNWEYAIVDEGHRMKNAQSKFAVTLGTQYQTKHRILLTGTPLQNSLPELWALLNFLLPSVFNSVETFDQWFNKPFAQFGTAAGPNDGDTEETVNTEERLLIIQRLHELLRPFMLRRIKADVLDQLPDKVEKVLRCELSSWQKELYRQISYSVLEDGQKKSKRGLNNVVMQLRKVCNHPYMFTPEGYYITEDIIRTSGKFELLDRMLPKLKAAGHRILMFFQMTAAMTIMEDYLKYRNLLSLRLDGSTTGEERERRMDLFNAPQSPYFIFMLSTRAGGLGLNLVTADTVIIFDSDWNPMMDLQAQDRAHRIGQKKVVSVFRLITNSPVEETILSRATEKLNMSELIVEAGKFDKSSVEEDTAGERQKIMEILLTDFDTTASKGQGTGATGSLPTSDNDDDEDGDSDEKEQIDVNELLSRNDEDFEFYTKLDAEKEKYPDLFESPGLLTDMEDIPDWIRYPNGVKEDSDSNENGIIESSKRRSVAQAKVYDDGLTEKQFLRMMEKQAQAEEDAAKSRKLEWKNQREKKMKTDSSSDIETSNRSGGLSDETLNRLLSMTKSIIAIRDPKSSRRYSDIFRDKPGKEEYPDYYKVIECPVSINDIMKKCRVKQYTSTTEYHNDWKLMFSNAVKFNGESSWIAADGKVLEVELNRLLQKYNVLDQSDNCPAPNKKRKPRIKLSLKKLTKKRKVVDASPTKGRKKSKTKKG